MLPLESGPTGGTQIPGSILRLLSVTLKLTKPGASMFNGREMTRAIHQAPNIMSEVLRMFLFATISAYLDCKLVTKLKFQLKLRALLYHHHHPTHVNFHYSYLLRHCTVIGLYGIHRKNLWRSCWWDIDITLEFGIDNSLKTNTDKHLKGAFHHLTKSSLL